MGSISVQEVIFSRKPCESIATPKFAPAAGYRIKWYYYPSSISRVKKKPRSGEFLGIQIVAKRRKHFFALQKKQNKAAGNSCFVLAVFGMVSCESFAP